jgi:hypothetical protein
LVRRTFVPDDKLEEKFINDKKKELSSVFLYIHIVCLFIYRYSNMSFKQEVYEDDMGDRLVQEHNDLNTFD